MWKTLLKFIKELFTPQFENLQYARKKCRKCGMVFDLHGWSMNGPGRDWYEPHGLPDKDIECNCVWKLVPDRIKEKA